MQNFIYLDEKILNWEVETGGWSVIDKNIRTRAEDLLERSDSHLNIDKSKDFRADCLVTLKRALNQRLKALEKIYGFKKLEIPDKPSGYFELLEKIGIVRPLLLKKLLKIRNDIEHEDAVPPSHNQCKEYIDVVWYFLKSTNRLVSFMSSSLEYTKLNRNGSETQYGFGLHIKDTHFKKVEISGWLLKIYLKKRLKNHNYLKIKIEKIETGEEVQFRIKGHEDKIPTDTFVSGIIELTDAQRLKLVQQAINI